MLETERTNMITIFKNHFLNEGRAMKRLVVIGFVSILFFGTPGPGGSQSYEKEGNPSPVVMERETDVMKRAVMDRVKQLESSISTLRLEIASLQKQLADLQIRPPLSSYKLPKEVTLCGERIPLEDRMVWENLDREFLIAMDNHAQILLWMKRARRYFPLIEKRLKEMNLPDDLKYVSIVESALRPHAVSSAGAAGIWQFVPSTGEKYGMKRSKTLDERFDFFKATEGALLYLKNLFEEFGSWSLALGAYNAGESRLRREIDLQKTRNYYYLDLPMETERYVYKIAVAKIILSDPKRFGFHLEDQDLYDSLRWERVRIELKQPLPIMEVARAIGSSYKELKEMNLHLLEETIPPGAHFFNLPEGTSERFLGFLNRWLKELEGKEKP